MSSSVISQIVSVSSNLSADKHCELILIIVLDGCQIPSLPSDTRQSVSYLTGCVCHRPFALQEAP
jgi:hypothetical protein